MTYRKFKNSFLLTTTFIASCGTFGIASHGEETPMEDVVVTASPRKQPSKPFKSLKEINRVFKEVEEGNFDAFTEALANGLHPCARNKQGLSLLMAVLQSPELSAEKKEQGVIELIKNHGVFLEEESVERLVKTSRKVRVSRRKEKMYDSENSSYGSHHTEIHESDEELEEDVHNPLEYGMLITDDLTEFLLKWYLENQPQDVSPEYDAIPWGFKKSMAFIKENFTSFRGTSGFKEHYLLLRGLKTNDHEMIDFAVNSMAEIPFNWHMARSSLFRGEDLSRVEIILNKFKPSDLGPLFNQILSEAPENVPLLKILLGKLSMSTSPIRLSESSFENFTGFWENNPDIESSVLSVVGLMDGDTKQSFFRSAFKMGHFRSAELLLDAGAFKQLGSVFKISSIYDELGESLVSCLSKEIPLGNKLISMMSKKSLTITLELFLSKAGSHPNLAQIIKSLVDRGAVISEHSLFRSFKPLEENREAMEAIRPAFTFISPKIRSMLISDALGQECSQTAEMILDSGPVEEPKPFGSWEPSSLAESYMGLIKNEGASSLSSKIYALLGKEDKDRVLFQLCYYDKYQQEAQIVKLLEDGAKLPKGYWDLNENLNIMLKKVRRADLARSLI